jgi:hypothetical protein
MMSVLDRLAAAARRPIAGLRDVRLARWIVVDRPTRLHTRSEGPRVELIHDGAVVASATVTDTPVRPARSSRAPAPLTAAQPADLPYTRGGIFHGPAFQYLTRLEIGADGATGVLDAARGSVPRGRLHQGLLDATVHVIPHDELWRWSDRIRPGCVGYPYRIPWMDFFDELPESGEVTVEARFAGFDDEIEILPAIDVHVRGGGKPLLAYRLVEVLVPLGPLARLDPPARATFLRDRRHVPDAGLATFDGAATHLSTEDLQALEWFPGTVAHLYDLPADSRALVGAEDTLAQVAVRDHVARRARVHPSAVVPSADLTSATTLGSPQDVYRVTVEREGGTITVRDAA